MRNDTPSVETLLDVTLTQATYAVFVRVPPDWFEPETVVREIAHALHVLRSSVRKRLAHLRLLGLVETRTSPTIGARLEVRKRSR